VIAEIETPRLSLPKIESGTGDPMGAVTGRRDLYDIERASFDSATIYDRAGLRTGDGIAGPAIIEQFDSTTIVLAGQSARVDDIGNLIIDTGAVE
jgi:N-methylhydantoinase A